MDKIDKKRLRKGLLYHYIKLFLYNLCLYPFFLLRYLVSNNTNIKPIDKNDFYGICVNLDKGDIQYELIDELGVKHIQIRVFLNDIKNIDSYVKFAQGFNKDIDIVITIIQDRQNIIDKKLLQTNIKIVFDKFKNISNEFIIGNAINRIKWGFITLDEYIKFYKTIYDIRDKYYKDYKLIGSSVIDFEYHFTIAILAYNCDIKYDAISSLLYVDRRGKPSNTQYLIFDLKRKIDFLYTIISFFKKTTNDIYITETNWPRKDTQPYAPTSQKECVYDEEYTKNMLEYFEIAFKTNKIKRVYWHQLIATGYGLVDNRDGKIKKSKAFFAFKEMVKNGH